MTVEPLDQTRGDSTPFLNGARTAALSRNEVAALCMKAARGAGMSWGLAEEAGFAAAWLVQHGFDGPRYLHAYLAEAQGRAWSDLCPTVAPGEWRAPEGRTLCPVSLGATLCDHATLAEGLAEGCPLRIGPVDHPVLLVPFLATIAGAADIRIELEWADGSVCIGGDPGDLAGAMDGLAGSAALSLTARPGPARAPAAAASPPIDADTIAALNALAMRTTVPPSEASRAGAGSTASDND
ncbi:DUF3726 domain-containing protein [Jannaschia rubra]|uniref:DUF3726 domain-containing protein n=1 Tax=Jannaschia rubra TaxID=282197 RepID=A0A0M6XJR1_9RHOB|nr:DUF3726 domain-containing protein [Jannaschia rubra]CTQ31339.1 hypothetical protein JAN5088_00094 [Jannaschia rubra]SFF81373.1 Protein of unknown function [Jannaschia rubra]